MNVGVVGAGSKGYVAGLVSAMVANMMPEAEMYKMTFSYDGQYLSRVYKTNSMRTRGDFVQHVAEAGFDYLDDEAQEFVGNVCVMNAFKVERI